MNTSKITKIFNHLDIFMYFILSLMLIQALSITGGFTFDSILPYMILLITISLWQEKYR